MPLNIEKQELTPEEKVLAEYKKRVREVAKEATKRHGWCSEVDNLLTELDIDSSGGVRITVQATLSATFEMNVDPETVAGLTPEEENAVLSELVAKQMPVGGGHNVRIGDLRMDLRDPQVTDANVYIPPVMLTADGWVFPAGYTPRGSETTRVVHIGTEHTQSTICDSWGHYNYVVPEPQIARRTLCANCRRAAEARGMTLESAR